MAISQYTVGQIPSRPIAIDVRDSLGNLVNLSSYTGFKAILIGSDNEEVDLTGSVLNVAGAAQGRFIFRWPIDRSVFTKPGEYVLHLEITGGSGTKDFTTGHAIKVRRLGGTN